MRSICSVLCSNGRFINLFWESEVKIICRYQVGTKKVSSFDRASVKLGHSEAVKKDRSNEWWVYLTLGSFLGLHLCSKQESECDTASGQIT
jgi:hypothetical protein